MLPVLAACGSTSSVYVPPDGNTLGSIHAWTGPVELDPSVESSGLSSATVPAGPVALDAVQGIEVLAAGAPVEFGHGKGGAVNIVTRSGGSQLHGGLYEYFSNNSLTAVDRYALGNNLFGKRNQFGFNLGGAIPKTKLFFFSNLEVTDGHGQRLGMGGGWYDRSFAFRRDRAAPPWLVGAGFGVQQVDALEGADWDILPDAICTESQTLLCARAPETDPA